MSDNGIISLYQSGHVLKLARDAAERSKTVPTEAEVAIILSASSLEGTLNELADLLKSCGAECELVSELLTDAEDSKASVKQKLRLLFFGLARKRLGNGS